MSRVVIGEPDRNAEPSAARARTPRRTGIGGRLTAGAVALGCLSVLALAAYLHADGRGHGTHEQLGLMKCAWPMLFDKPCPTCGMTTSFTHAANADLLSAVQTQPFGAALAIGTSVMFWMGLYVALTGSRIWAVGMRMLNGRTIAVLGLLALAAWVYKVLTWHSAG